MTTSNSLIIIIWACQEMMAWMSIELIGSVDFIRILAWKPTANDS
jgi:hypothetical protein